MSDEIIKCLGVILVIGSLLVVAWLMGDALDSIRVTRKDVAAIKKHLGIEETHP